MMVPTNTHKYSAICLFTQWPCVNELISLYLYACVDTIIVYIQTMHESWIKYNLLLPNSKNCIFLQKYKG